MKNRIFEIILGLALAMGIYVCWPETKQPVQVNIPLYSVEEIQRELVRRGHDIKIDGKFGANTDLALTREVTK